MPGGRACPAAGALPSPVMGAAWPPVGPVVVCFVGLPADPVASPATAPGVPPVVVLPAAPVEPWTGAPRPLPAPLPVRVPAADPLCCATVDPQPARGRAAARARAASCRAAFVMCAVLRRAGCVGEDFAAPSRGSCSACV